MSLCVRKQPSPYHHLIITCQAKHTFKVLLCLNVSITFMLEVKGGCQSFLSQDIHWQNDLPCPRQNAYTHKAAWQYHHTLLCTSYLSHTHIITTKAIPLILHTQSHTCPPSCSLTWIREKTFGKSCCWSINTWVCLSPKPHCTIYEMTYVRFLNFSLFSVWTESVFEYVCQLSTKDKADYGQK